MIWEGKLQKRFDLPCISSDSNSRRLLFLHFRIRFRPWTISSLICYVFVSLYCLRKKDVPRMNHKRERWFIWYFVLNSDLMVFLEILCSWCVHHFFIEFLMFDPKFEKEKVFSVFVEFCQRLAAFLTLTHFFSLPLYSALNAANKYCAKIGFETETWEGRKRIWAGQTWTKRKQMTKETLTRGHDSST